MRRAEKRSNKPGRIDPFILFLFDECVVFVSYRVSFPTSTGHAAPIVSSNTVASDGAKPVRKGLFTQQERHSL